MSIHDEIDASGPDSWWKLDEASGTFADSAGSFSGTAPFPLYYSQTPVTPDDPGGKSVLFVASDGSRINFTDIYDFTGSAQFTAMCWLRPGAYNSGAGHTLWCNMGISTDGWGLILANPAVTFRMIRGDAAGFNQVDYTMSEATYEAGNPLMITMRYNGTNLILNVNGVDVVSTASSKSVTDNTDGLSFGAYNVGGSGYDGYADDLVIWSYALTEAALLNIYQGGTGEPPDEEGGEALARNVATNRGVSW